MSGNIEVWTQEQTINRKNKPREWLFDCQLTQLRKEQSTKVDPIIMTWSMVGEEKNGYNLWTNFQLFYPQNLHHKVSKE